MSDQTFEFLEPVIAAEAIVLINEVQQLSSGQSTHQSVDELVRLFCIRVLATLNAKGATLKQESKKLDEANKVMAIHSFLACRWNSCFRTDFLSHVRLEEGLTATSIDGIWRNRKKCTHNYGIGFTNRQLFIIDHYPSLTRYRPCL
ncbi:hypothetical protein I312_106616 [Cryptococcus bacillisporus CA1280]|uniref:uncharacterized protein n=1 Tax=Cryptococcus bacillisporus CA1280 TaxID=1296109 RepID=UPI003366EF4F